MKSLHDLSDKDGSATKSRSPFEYMAGNPVAAWLIAASLLVLGLYSALNMTIERYAPLEQRIVSVVVPYAGATPRQVEEDIIRRVEESLIGIDGVDRLTANAREGLGEILIEFAQWQDLTAKLEEVRTAIDRMENFPPNGADQAEVRRREVMRGILSLVLISDTATEEELRLAADELREELLLLPLPRMVAVDLVGARDREIQIALDETILRSHQLSVNQVVSQIRSSSQNLSGGNLRVGSDALALTSLEKRHNAADFEDIVILSQPDGSIIRLRDIAALRDGFVEDPLLSTIDGATAVFIEVSAPVGINPRGILREIENRLVEYDLPPGMELDVWIDNNIRVNKPLLSIASSAIIGIALVFVILILLLELRIAIWVAVGIPTAIIGSFILLNAMGQTLHLLSVIGFIIVVGIVVDDAIIVAENIMRNRESGGLRTQKTTTASAREVMAPVVVGVLTTIIAFAALIPLDGLIGQAMSKIAIVVIVVLMLSLFEAFFLLPAHVSGSRQLALWPLVGLQRAAKESFDGFIEQRLIPTIDYSIRRPQTTILLFAVVAAIAGGLLLTNILRFNSVANNLDEQQLQLDLTLTPDLTFQDSLRAAEQIAEAAREANSITGGSAIKAINVMVGRHKPVENQIGLKAAEPGANLASVQLQLNTIPEREVSVVELRNVWLESIGTIRGAEKAAFPLARGFATPAIGFVLQHPDEEKLLAAARILKQRLLQHEPVYEIVDNLELGNRRYEIQLTDMGSAAGLSPEQLAMQLQNRFFGSEAERIVRRQDELRVMARYPLENRLRPSDLQDERINLPGGKMATFPNIATMEETQELAWRQRVDGLPSISIDANYIVTETSSREFEDLVFGQWIPELQQSYPELQYKRNRFSHQTQKVMTMLSATFPAALLLMFALMSIQLRSILQPLYILASIPMTVAGALILHLLTGYDLTLPALCGIVAATGIVVNDGLVLLDMYNKIRRDDPSLEVEEAILRAARVRARPILLTTVTTIVGLMPLLYNRSESIDFYIGITISLIGGLALASISMLLLIPALMALFERRFAPIFRG